MRKFFKHLAVVTAALGALAPVFMVSPALAADEGPLVLVVGAAGRTGGFAVEEARAKGYRVRAFVRDIAADKGKFVDAVEVVQGDVRDPAAIAPAMKGVTYVISAIGAGGMKPAPGNGPEEVDNQGNVNLVKAAQAAGVKHFVLVSSGGVSQADTFPVPFMRPILAAKWKSEEFLRQSGLPYTVARPGGLIDPPAEPTLIVLTQGDGSPGRVSRQQVAQVCVAALGNAAAAGKTFEIAAVPGTPTTDFTALFAALETDKARAAAAPTPAVATTPAAAPTLAAPPATTGPTPK
jgi:uncharacterized protein YbjT (DUF2867 family)